MKKLIKNVLKNIPFRIVYLITRIPFLKLKIIDEIRPYFNQTKMRHYSVPPKDESEGGARIIIYGLRSHLPSDLAVFEKVLADALSFQGARVYNLLCGNLLSSCDGTSEGESHRYSCIMCRNQMSFFKKCYPGNFLSFPEFITESDIESLRRAVAGLSAQELMDFTFLGVNVGRHALNSCNKYYRHGVFNQNNERHRETLRHNVLQGMIITHIAKNVVEKIKPTHLVTLHGGYSTWGPISDYFANCNLTVYRYEKSVNQVGSFYITKLGDDLNDIVARDVWEDSKSKELDQEKKDTLYRFLMEKKEGTSFEYRLYRAGKREYHDERLTSMLERSTDKKKFALYPHVIWDKGYITRYDALGSFFEDDVEWMLETVKFFWNRTDSLLFIKPHPGERLSFDLTLKGSKEIIMEHFGELPDHIIAIDNDYPISSFDLMDRGCIGLVYTSTVGLEHSYFKKPVLVAGNIHYKFAGAVLEVNTKEEYFGLIEDPAPLYKFIQDNYDVVEKYAYHYYFTQQVEMPFYRKDVLVGHCIKWEVLKDYKQFVEHDPSIGNIAQSIINRSAVVTEQD